MVGYNLILCKLFFSSGERVLLRGKEYVGEVMSCENSSTLPKVAEMFSFTLNTDCDVISVDSDDSDDLGIIHNYDFSLFVNQGELVFEF